MAQQRIDIYSTKGEALVITGVEQVLIFRCRELHLCKGDEVKFTYDFVVEGYLNDKITSTYSDPILLVKEVTEDTIVRSIIISVIDDKRTIELSDVERPNAYPVS